jgi:predicted membrane protein
MNKTKLVAGIFFVILGVLLTLDQFDVVYADRVLRYWPVVLIVIGLLNLNNAGRRGLAILSIAIGSLMVAVRARVLHFTLFDFWPLILIGIGFVIVLRALGVNGPEQRGGLWSVLGTRKVTLEPQDLDGRQIVAFMGRAQVELANTGEHEGPVTVEVLAMWGGVEFRVPSGWEVVAEVVPVMGGIDIKALAPPSGRKLIVRGLVLMAGMDVKNVRTA